MASSPAILPRASEISSSLGRRFPAKRSRARTSLLRAARAPSMAVSAPVFASPLEAARLPCCPRNRSRRRGGYRASSFCLKRAKLGAHSSLDREVTPRMIFTAWTLSLESPRLFLLKSSRSRPFGFLIASGSLSPRMAFIGWLGRLITAVSAAPSTSSHVSSSC